MTITNELFDTRTLLGVMEAQAPVNNYWLDLCFPNQVNFTTEEIEFEKLTRYRVLAPLVIPTAQGRPSYKKASRVTRLRPAYVKPKDVVNESDIIARQPGTLLGAPPSRQQSFDARVADILNEQNKSIQRRWEWLASEAIQDGAVTLVDNDYPQVTVDFGRNSNHTVTLTGGDLWDSGTGDIIGDINEWRFMMRQAKFGGPATRMTVGTDAWAAMSQDPAVMELMDITVRGTQVNLNRGTQQGEVVEFMGSFDNTLDVYLYRDYYEDNDGNTTDFMSPKDIVLTGPNIMGYRCFGAILDKRSQFQALPIFPKMWDDDDPPVTYLMSQSAPLMVPVNPDNTLRATVVS